MCGWREAVAAGGPARPVRASRGTRSIVIRQRRIRPPFKLDRLCAFLSPHRKGRGRRLPLLSQCDNAPRFAVVLVTPGRQESVIVPDCQRGWMQVRCMLDALWMQVRCWLHVSSQSFPCLFLAAGGDERSPRHLGAFGVRRLDAVLDVTSNPKRRRAIL